jgi:hypothetical protein
MSVEEKEKNTDLKNTDPLCEDCGEALAEFLQGIADHNAKVTACPKCGKNHEFKPPKTVKTFTSPRSRKTRTSKIDPAKAAI